MSYFYFIRFICLVFILLCFVSWHRCPGAGEDAGAPRVGLSRLKWVAQVSEHSSIIPADVP